MKSLSGSKPAKVPHLAPALLLLNNSTGLQESNQIQGQTDKALQDKQVRPECSQHSFFPPLFRTATSSFGY